MWRQRANKARSNHARGDQIINNQFPAVQTVTKHSEHCEEGATGTGCFVAIINADFTYLFALILADFMVKISPNKIFQITIKIHTSDNSKWLYMCLASLTCADSPDAFFGGYFEVSFERSSYNSDTV